MEQATLIVVVFAQKFSEVVQYCRSSSGNGSIAFMIYLDGNQIVFIFVYISLNGAGAVMELQGCNTWFPGLAWANIAAEPFNYLCVASGPVQVGRCTCWKLKCALLWIITTDTSNYSRSCNILLRAALDSEHSWAKSWDCLNGKWTYYQATICITQTYVYYACRCILFCN